MRHNTTNVDVVSLAITVALLVLGLLCATLAFGATETVKKFEVTSTLELLADDPCVSTPCTERWSLGKHIAIVSNDGSIKAQMSQLRGRRVRVIIYEVQP